MKKYQFFTFDFTSYPSGKGQSYLIDFSSQTIMLRAGSTILRFIHLKDEEIRQICTLIDKYHVKKWHMCYWGRKEKRGISWRIHLQGQKKTISLCKGFNGFPDEWYDLCIFFQRYWDYAMKNPLKFEDEEIA